MASEDIVRLLRAARVAEKQQTLFYRALAGKADEAAAPEDIEALNGLLADEQHHLSRLSARLVELGHETGAMVAQAPPCDLASWRATARQREGAEIERYEELLRQPLDEVTGNMIRAMLATEREHARNLGGKYTEAI